MNNKHKFATVLVALIIGVFCSFNYAGDLDDPAASSVTVFTLTDFVEDFNNGSQAGGILRAFGDSNVLGESIDDMLSSGDGVGRTSDGSIRLSTGASGFGANDGEKFIGFSKDIGDITLSGGTTAVFDVSSSASSTGGFNAISYWIKNDGDFSSSDVEVVIELVIGDGGDTNTFGDRLFNISLATSDFDDLNAGTIPAAVSGAFTTFPGDAVVTKATSQAPFRWRITGTGIVDANDASIAGDYILEQVTDTVDVFFDNTTFNGSTWTQNNPVLVRDLGGVSNVQNGFVRQVVNLSGSVSGTTSGFSRAVGPSIGENSLTLDDTLLGNISAVNIVMRVPSTSSDTTAARSIFVDDINFFENISISVAHVDRVFAKSGSGGVFTLLATVTQNGTGASGQNIVVTSTGAGTFTHSAMVNVTTLVAPTDGDGKVQFTYSVPNVAEVAKITVTLQ